jgi:hypothetical protein
MSKPHLHIRRNEFLVLKLGTAPFVVVPLICSELIWPQLWDVLEGQTEISDIDVVPVLQHNNDLGRYWDPVIHNAYQRNLQSRFVLANQGLDLHSDGMCFVLMDLHRYPLVFFGKKLFPSVGDLNSEALDALLRSYKGIVQ